MMEPQEFNPKTAEEVKREVSGEADRQMSLELPDERERRFQSPGFSRLRLTWSGSEGHMMSQIHSAVDTAIQDRFGDAYTIMYELYDLVRDELVDPQTLKPILDGQGAKTWARSETGNYMEDWERLTYKQRERFLFQITTRLFAWSQRATEVWGESMFAKAIWEEAFSEGFESLEPISATRPTIEDRKNRAQLHSKEKRYFAIYLSYYSRKADSLVRTMELLCQRLKDVHNASTIR